MREVGEITTVVYVDLALAINFIMDFFILWAAGRLAGLHVKVFRLVCGSLLGAAYSLVIFFPEAAFLTSFSAKILCSAIMALAAFAPTARNAFLRALVCLYFVSFAMGGSVLAAMYLANDPPQTLAAYNGIAVYPEDSIGWLAAGIGAAMLTGYGGYAVLRARWMKHNLVKPLTVCLGQRQVTVEALLDTGNHLYDPVGRKPVVLVEAKALGPLLPAAVQKTAAAGSLKPNLAELANSVDEEWAVRLNLIPYHTVGSAGGLLLGFRPDWLEIQDGRERIHCTDAVIGLTDRALSKNGHYRALLHPELFRQVSQPTQRGKSIC